MKTNIKDIAKKIGVSASTVSKALNNKNDVGIEMKEKILKTAQEMNYIPNISAQRLVNGKSKTIGVFIFSRDKIKLEESSAFKYIEIFLKETQKRDYDLLIFSVDNLKKRKNYIELAMSKGVEGVIFIGLDKNDSGIENIKNSKIPVVILEEKLEGERVSSLYFNNEKGIEAILEYLTELNHKKIAIIKGDFKTGAAEERFLAFKRVLKLKNIYEKSLVFQGDFSLESGYEIGKKISKLKEKPTAVLSTNDLMGIGAISAFIDSGISVPKDISVTGYDNFKISEFYNPKLTTVDQNFNLLGTKAIETLFNMLENKINKVNVEFIPEIIIRESCIKIEK